ncbi:MAG: type II secretion system F family protein, partial [Sedimenticola sp.]|nr:type II secretion system F family protein [Sedimenticola sp.]
MATATTAKKAPKAEKAYIFTWEGADKHGKRIKGESRAASIALVRADLRRQGINPLKVKKKATSIFNKKQKITPGDIAIFARQLSTMMEAGVPLVQAFDIVGKGHNNPSMQDLILSIKADVEGGTALAEALAKHPLYFDDLFCNLVQAGEAAGVLENLLDKIATYKEKTESIKG